MKHIFIGLGNPGGEYELTRHNTGRFILETLSEKHGFSKWGENKKLNALVSEGEIGKHDAQFILPETFMNKSGFTVKKLATSLKRIHKLVVISDDIDLPLGSFKISYGKGDAGHNGIKSIIRALGTKDFIRLRVGISPKIRGSNQPKKPIGEKKVLEFLMSKFRRPEEVVIILIANDIYEAMEVIMEDGYEQAMNEFN